MLSIINKVLLLMRFVLCCLPLPGYIHPDEFFQSPEIAGDDVLGFKTTRTWEWDMDSPARSIIFPMISSGLPFLLLKMIKSLFGISYTSYVLLVLPRLWITMWSYVIDVTIEKIALTISKNQGDKFQKRKGICIFIFRSSAVAIVFFTRTFSNVVEAVLFTLLVWRVLSQLNQDSFERDLNGTTVGIALIVTIGFFIRPTFLLFATFGSLVYLTLCIKNGKLLSQTVIALVTATVASSCVIYMDSIYFSTVDNFKFTITPFNLIKYNLDPKSLTLHGEHSRFLHLIVNCPLLFGPLFGFFILGTAEVVLLSYNLPKKRQFEFNLMFLVGSTWFPIFMLSYFKHQEPRYILPAISTMCLVASWTLERRPMLWKRLIRLWVIFNTALTAWFGFVHQGGVVPCLSHLNREIGLSEMVQSSNPCVKYDVLLWYTYMGPQHLIPNEKDASSRQIVFHNLGSIPEYNVTKLIRAIISPGEKNDMTCRQKVRLYMITHLFYTKVRSLGIQNSFPTVLL